MLVISSCLAKYAKTQRHKTTNMYYLSFCELEIQEMLRWVTSAQGLS